MLGDMKLILSLAEFNAWVEDAEYVGIYQENFRPDGSSFWAKVFQKDKKFYRLTVEDVRDVTLEQVVWKKVKIVTEGWTPVSSSGAK